MSGRSFQWRQTDPLVQAIGLVVLPHVLHHQLHCVDVWHLPMEVHLHQGCHSCQKAWNLFQLLAGVVDTVRPRVINQENAVGSTTTHTVQQKAFLDYRV